MELLPQVHLIDGVQGCNVYLLLDKRMCLIDSGLPGNTEAIINAIRRLGRSPLELGWIILTHTHIDHAGSTAALQEATGARVVAHRAETATDVLGRSVLQPVGPGWRRPSQRDLRDAILVDMPVSSGETIRCLDGLQVVHTPGHTPGSISLLQPDRHVLFAGDLVVRADDALARPPEIPEPDQLQTSLRQVADLDFDTVCMGHGRPMFEGGKAALGPLLQYATRTARWWSFVRYWRSLLSPGGISGKS